MINPLIYIVNNLMRPLSEEVLLPIITIVLCTFMFLLIICGISVCTMESFGAIKTYVCNLKIQNRKAEVRKVN